MMYEVAHLATGRLACCLLGACHDSVPDSSNTHCVKRKQDAFRQSTSAEACITTCSHVRAGQADERAYDRATHHA
eukprot:31412-Eustigmatos_ZCMA.PRE.1